MSWALQVATHNPSGGVADIEALKFNLLITLEV